MEKLLCCLELTQNMKRVARRATAQWIKLLLLKQPNTVRITNLQPGITKSQRMSLAGQLADQPNLGHFHWILRLEGQRPSRWPAWWSPWAPAPAQSSSSACQRCPGRPPARTREPRRSFLQLQPEHSWQVGRVAKQPEVPLNLTQALHIDISTMRELYSLLGSWEKGESDGERLVQQSG